MMSNSPRYWVYVFAATAVAIILRALIASNGSVWADEGTFLNVIAAPTTREMITFLKSHESHPPLFYLVMRAWSYVANDGDRGLMMLPVALGAAIVPAMFAAGRELFSEKVGTIAAILAVIAPSLTEHASQFRPYGLLSLCALVSTASLIVAVTTPNRRAWTIHSVATAAMLYTHNWGWLIAAGQVAAALLIIRSQPAGMRRSVVAGAAMSWLGILAIYSVWIPSFLFQGGHAGHGPLPLENLADYLGYIFFSVYVIVESLLVGRHGERQVVAIAGLAAATIAFGAMTWKYTQRDSTPDTSLARVRARMCVNIALFALIAALILSPLNNLILPRSVATVMPMLLLAAAYWLNRVVDRATARSAAQLGGAVLGFAFAAAIIQTTALLSRPRSNAGRIANEVRANAQPDDLLIVAPEWFAPAFDRYFPASIEQIDYPYETRTTMVDFSNIWLTKSQSTAPQMIRARIEKANREGRRIWFVVEHRYLRAFKPGELETAYRNKRPDAITVRDIHFILATLDSLYGNPTKVFEAREPRPLYDDMLAYMYAR